MPPTLDSTPSILADIIRPSLVTLYILRCFYIDEKTRAGVAKAIAEGMERLLSRARSGRLGKKLSGRGKGKKPLDLEHDIDTDVESPAATAGTEVDVDVDASRLSSDQFSISPTPPAVYGSTVSLAEAPSPMTTIEPNTKPGSRRSSISQAGKKPSLQHVGFQSPEVVATGSAFETEAEAETETEPTTPKPMTGGPPRKSVSGRRGRIMPALMSLVSRTASGKSQHSVRGPQSTTAVRRMAAYKAVDDNFPTTKPAHVAIGSGSMMVQVAERISQYPHTRLANVTFVSTGVASEHIMASYKLRPITALNLLSPEQRIDVYFDSADEVDDELNCIRGRTTNLHLERLIALRADCFVCTVDYHKRVPTLFTAGGTMPVEVTPESYFHVLGELRASGATAALRSGSPAVSGPCFTTRGMYFVDVGWPALQDSSGDVKRLADMVKGIYGVVDHGLFYAGDGIWNGRPSKVYVGLEDGTVETLEAPE
ncbi:hypothetical protein DRE_06465 [Drechslerella stenobrocha 248]|uniref:Ribose-5-phosphate isomerase n=1 Tax=Drechslerella stenobrocha 248 TaxID=1043628 RepID=W7HXI3_9PEZI|nr:hypothetical protein DRE_06465 [Drechslerella stenobrocha 248]